MVIQVTEENGRFWVSPPGNVLHVKHGKAAGKQVTFVYLECPADKKRKSLENFAKQIGGDAEKQLRRNGIIRQASFARAVLTAWNK